MTNRIQLRRDTSANWTRVNPILEDGEPGLDTTTNQIKYGDGSTDWDNLPYASGGGGGDSIVNGNYSVSVGANGVVTMETSRGNLEFGALPEIGGSSHFHIMRASGDNADLYFGDDFNYMLQRGPANAGNPAYGVEIGTNSMSGDQQKWRFETDGILTMPPGNETTSGWIQWSHASDDLTNVAGAGFVDYFNAYSGLGLTAPTDTNAEKGIWFGTPADPTNPFQPETSMVFRNDTLYLPKNGYIKSHDINRVGYANLTTVGTTITIQTTKETPTGSIEFNRTSNSYLTLSDYISLTTDPFTIAFWFYPTILTGYHTILSQYPTQNLSVYINETILVIDPGGSDNSWELSGVLNINTWHYIVISSTGTGGGTGLATISAWVNGTRVGTAQPTLGTGNGNYGGGANTIGRFWYGSNYSAMKLASLHIVVGTALYNPSLTTIPVAYAAPTAVANTKLLLLATDAGTAYTDSSNMLTVTNHGTTWSASTPDLPITAINDWEFGTDGALSLPLVTKLNSGGVDVPNSAEIGTSVRFAGPDIVDSEIFMGSGYGEFRSIYNNTGPLQSGLVYAGVEGFNYAQYGDVNFAGMVSQTPNIDSMYTVGLNESGQITIGFTQEGQTQASTDWGVVVGTLNTDMTVNGLFANTTTTVIGSGLSAWAFGTDGSLTLPGGSAIGYTPSVSTNITVNAKTWAFGVDGNLTLPTDGEIHSAAGTGSVAIEANDGNNTRTWTFGAAGTLGHPVLTVATLPPATVAGQRVFVSDADGVTRPAFDQIVTAGGTGGPYTVPVWSDGTNWRVG
jgi:hypothetical protein